MIDCKFIAAIAELVNTIILECPKEGPKAQDWLMERLSIAIDQAVREAIDNISTICDEEGHVSPCGCHCHVRVAMERERCAKVAEDSKNPFNKELWNHIHKAELPFLADFIAAKIREGGTGE